MPARATPAPLNGPDTHSTSGGGDPASLPPRPDSADTEAAAEEGVRSPETQTAAAAEEDPLDRIKVKLDFSADGETITTQSSPISGNGYGRFDHPVSASAPVMTSAESSSSAVPTGTPLLDHSERTLSVLLSVSAEGGKSLLVQVQEDNAAIGELVSRKLELEQDLQKQVGLLSPRTQTYRTLTHTCIHTHTTHTTYTHMHTCTQRTHTCIHTHNVHTHAYIHTTHTHMHTYTQHTHTTRMAPPLIVQQMR